MQICTRFSSP